MKEQKVYIQVDSEGLPFNVDAQAALDGFKNRGYKIIPCHTWQINSYPIELFKKYTFVLNIDTSLKVFKKLDIEYVSLDKQLYNTCKQLYFRKSNIITLDEFLSNFKETTENWEDEDKMFIKPLEFKSFDGLVFDKHTNLSILHKLSDSNIDVLVTEYIKSIEAEYRCFVYNKKIVDIRRQKGDYVADKKFDPTECEQFLKTLESNEKMPIAYSIDLSMDHLSRFQLIEVQDCFAIGHYGIDPEIYSIMLEERWKEIFK